MRYERKFECRPYGLGDVLHELSVHPSHFREIYHERVINNIYWDTPTLDFLRANLDGVARRAKIRIRWYGELFGEAPRPTLEFKRKNGLVGTKDQYRMPALSFPRQVDPDLLRAFAASGGAGEAHGFELLALEPALVNRYRRRYFLSADRSVRVTLDWDMSYWRILPGGAVRGERTDAADIVLEVKYDRLLRDIDRLTNVFPFRLSRFSKYVMGMDAVSFAVSR